MSAVTTPSASVYDRQWFIVGRWQEFDGELRVNLLRIIAIGAFYLVELIKYYSLTAPDPHQQMFHRAATALAVAWVMMALLVMLCLRRRILPSGLKYVSTGVDLVLLTALAHLLDGAQSSIVDVYFLIIAMACLRFQLRLIWFATLGAVVGYEALVVLRDPDWFGPALDAGGVNTDRIVQLVTVVSLGLTGIVMGQVVRRVRALAEDYQRRLEVQRGRTP